MSSMPTPATRSASADAAASPVTPRSDRARRRTTGSVRVAPAPQVDAPIGRHAEAVGRFVRRDDERGRQVDVHHRDQVLRVRVRDHAVVGRRVRRTRRRCARPGTTPAGCAPRSRSSARTARPSDARYSSGATPRCARRATSHNANVVYAWNTWCAISAGWNGASNGNGACRSGLNDHCGRSPAFRSRRTVSSASAPHTIADVEVAAHDRLRGVVDEHLRRGAADAGVVAVLRLDAERDRTADAGGSSYCHDWQYTICSDSTAPSTSLLAPASSAARAAHVCSHSTSGSGDGPVLRARRSPARRR